MSETGVESEVAEKADEEVKTEENKPNDEGNTEIQEQSEAKDQPDASKDVSQEPTPRQIDHDELKESILNPAADFRNLRRIIAEDSEWNLALVPLLSQMSINHIVDQFAFNSTMLNKLPPSQRIDVLRRIPTNLPLKVTAHLIEDEDYWCRVCQSRWQICDVSHYAGSWKRMLFERNMEEIIENFVPEKTDTTRLNETLVLSAPYIRRLNIKQLLPPLKLEIKEKVIVSESNEDASDIESETDEPVIQEHFDLSIVVSQLPHLVELRISYGVMNCGMNFEWSLFQFTSKDCQMIAKCVASATQLKVFQLHKSRVDCDKCRVIISNILNHPSLEELDFSHNSIGDRGARALGKFINGNEILLKLLATNNCIRAAGGQAIAHALTKNTKLNTLDLRLNRLGDEGGQAICKALLKNSSLVDVNLAANEMTEPTAAILSQVVAQNKILTHLDVSNNRLGADGGKQLQEGLEDNDTLLQLDLRFTDCGQEAEFCISQIIERNQEKSRANDPNGGDLGNIRSKIRPVNRA